MIRFEKQTCSGHANQDKTSERSAQEAYKRTCEIDAEIAQFRAAHDRMRDQVELLSKVFVFVDDEQVAKDMIFFKDCPFRY